MKKCVKSFYLIFMFLYRMINYGRTYMAEHIMHKKETKKAPQKTMKEKREEKKNKKKNSTSNIPNS